MRIGRSRDNHVVLPDEGPPAASRHHAEVLLENGQWWLADLDSANGTLVNGRPVRRERLRSGDRVRVGAEELLVEIGPTSTVRGAWLPVAAALVLVLGAVVAIMLRSAAGFERAAEAAARATYMLAVEENARRKPVGTGFAVTADGLLATNAHVASELQRRMAGGARVVAVRTEPERDTRVVLRAWLHPGWEQGSLRDDVALVTVDGSSTSPLRLARPPALAELVRGTPVAAFGFPAAATNPASPTGRLTRDVIGEMRGDRYVGVGLQIAPGTSGSPIFLEDGSVVALVAGGDFPPGPADAPGPPGAGVNWGVSVRPLSELLERVRPR